MGNDGTLSDIIAATAMCLFNGVEDDVDVRLV